jgi:hypothetical protein
MQNHRYHRPSLIAPVTAIIAVYAQTMHARHLCYPKAVREGHRMVGVISPLDDGRLHVGYSEFRDVGSEEEVESAVAEAGVVADGETTLLDE